MTSQKRESPAAEKHPPSEIISTVRQTMNRHNIPAVSSREVSKQLDYDDDYTTTKLNSLVDDGRLKSFRTGAGFIYWIPEEGEEGGEVNVSSVGTDSINLDNIDPNDVPLEVARNIAEAQLPEFEDDNWWQNQYKTGNELTQAGAVGFGIGIGVLLVDAPLVEGFTVPELVLMAAALLFLFGGTALFIGALVMLVSYFGQRAAKNGWVPAEPSFPWS